jgi:RNA polymerase sigma-70 factor (ECF subfamily)
MVSLSENLAGKLAQEPEKSEPKDEELAGRMAQGDQAALEAIIQRWHGPVYSLAMRILRDAATAEEITQDVFLKAWRSADSFDRAKGAFSSWILTLAHHSAVDNLRRQKARGKDLLRPFDDFLASTLPGPRKGVSPWQKLRMERALSELSEPQRQVVEMAYFEGLTRDEIAARLSEPVGTIKTRLRDALIRLHKIFSDPERELQSLPGFRA